MVLSIFIHPTISELISLNLSKLIPIFSPCPSALSIILFDNSSYWFSASEVSKYHFNSIIAETVNVTVNTVNKHF